MSYQMRVLSVQGRAYVSLESIMDLALSGERTREEREILRKLMLDAKEVVDSTTAKRYPWE